MNPSLRRLRGQEGGENNKEELEEVRRSERREKMFVGESLLISFFRIAMLCLEVLNCVTEWDRNFGYLFGND